MSEVIYFDNAATTKICDEALQEFILYSKEIYYNPSAAYTPAVKIERAINDAQTSIKENLYASSGQIIFTSGGTESDNIAILASAEKNRKKHIVISCIEHPAVLKTCCYLKDVKGYELTILPVDGNGQVNACDLQDAILDETFLVSIMHVNNETGTIQDIKKLCYIAKEKNKDILFHSDGVQAFGKIHINIDELGVDMYSLSSHKIHGPKGMGALYVKNLGQLSPIVFGGGQQLGYRSGTYNHPGILAFSKAVGIFKYNTQNSDRIGKIKKYLIDEITNKIQDTLVISKYEDIFCNNILNIAFKDINAETLLHSAQYKNLLISTGSACSAKRNIVSTTLSEMDVDKYYIGGAIRISLSSYNTIDEAKKAVDILIECVNNLRKYTK